MPFMMTDEMDGLYVPHEDVPALRGALERLMSNEALRRRIGDAGRASVHERFSGERYCDDLLACVNGLYGEGDRTRGAPEESGFGRSRTVSAPSG
jgi:glycosyltransferase involved in cell wall biosynthesis